MASLKNHSVSDRATVLLMGDSGTGKTSSIASLANAGYKVRIVDFDNGLDVLPSYIDADKMDNVSYVTLVDDITIKPTDVNKSAFARFVNNYMLNWKDGDEDFGPIAEWDSDTVLVIDSLSMMSEAALFRVLLRDGKKIVENPSQPQWGDAMRDVEGVLRLLSGNRLKCNVVCTAHVVYIEEGIGQAKPYPSVIGNKLPPKIAKYFNTVVGLGVDRQGNRVMQTTSDNRFAFKNAAPNLIEPVMKPDLSLLLEKLRENARTKNA